MFDKEDPIMAAYRRMFPNLFKDGAIMPPGLRNYVRYPELLLKLQAEVYGLYHMTDPEASTTVRICGQSPPRSA